MIGSPEMSIFDHMAGVLNKTKGTLVHERGLRLLDGVEVVI